MGKGKGKPFNGDSPVFVVGGGASLLSFDWLQLKGKQVLAIKDAWRKVPDCNVFFFADHKYYEQNRDRYQPARDFWRFNGERIFTTLDGFDAHPKIERLMPAHIAPRRPKELPLDISTFNSGYQGVYAAFALGASNVVLLGFDNMAGRWSDAEAYKTSGSVSDSVYIQYAKDAAALADYGLPIINASDVVRGLTAFHIEPLSAYFKV